MKIPQNVSKLLLLFNCLLLSSCILYGLDTEVKEPNLLNDKTTVFIFRQNDDVGIKKKVEEKLEAMGFAISGDKNSAELLADYNYLIHWDVVHYTFENFYFFLTDNKTKKVIVESHWWGGTPLGVESIIERIMEDVKEKLGIGEGTGKVCIGVTCLY